MTYFKNNNQPVVVEALVGIDIDIDVDIAVVIVVVIAIVFVFVFLLLCCRFLLSLVIINICMH